VAADLALDLALAYDVTFGWPEQWGTPGDVRDDLQYDPDVLSVLVPQLLSAQSDPLALAKFEFIRRVLDLPANDFYPDPADLIGRPGGFLVDMAFATQARAEIEQRANGAVSQNRDHVYSLSSEDFLAVGGLGGDPVQWLAGMNAATTYAARRASREYVERYAAFAGDLKRPVLTLHTTVDPINPPFHERLYAETVNGAGKSALLRQLYTDGVGHCQFTGPQLVAAILGLEATLQYGAWPPDEFFAAAGGFDFTYVPPQPYYRPAPAGDLDSLNRSGTVAGMRIYLPLASK
jgi:pimeloyl-ACP methyl ester carboxylesterase